MSHESTIGRYLLDRVAATGVRHVFGVPGDYNLAFLDQIEAHPDLTWVGNANELNASYMADGYARLNGLAMLLTTYGVGELSAMNGIAGAYVENVPVLHVVGAPATAVQRRGLPVHHSLLDGDFEHFLRAAREITCAAVSLTADGAADQIDRVLGAVLNAKKPGYLALPADLVGWPCAASAPGLVPATDDGAAVHAFTENAARMLRGATTVTVLVDSLTRRHWAGDRLDALVRKGRLPVAVTTSGKGAVDETLETFAGLYQGAISEPEVRTLVEDADVIIGVGLLETDLNSGIFTTRIDPAKLIGIQPFHATAGAARIGPLSMHRALDELGGLVGALPPARVPAPVQPPVEPVDPDTPLRQDLLWQRVGRFVRPGDVIAADQGTAFYGLLSWRLPADVEVIGQHGWASIGHALPALAGAQLASSPRRRSILLIGDGAVQLVVQELGVIAREGLDPIVFIVNNDGYTLERAINGWNAAYNDIVNWDWTVLPAALGADAHVSRARTVGELDRALAALPAHEGRLRIVEVILDKHDLPQILRITAESVAKRNAA
ncbi:alpha-keto acid decarboxylase family protein [Dactylosporangium sp. CA-092794]|uniref:alpha-keto acid decarboxylase family protein n=1 Tax=Dactylosporangium sp. CA-092794 TaxID=3239929 RepID=UPI003D92922E